MFGVVVGAHGLLASRRKRREKNPLRQRSVVGAASSKRAKQLGPLGCNAGHSPEQIPSSPFCFRRSAAAAAAGDLGAGGRKERTENPPGPPLTDGVPSSPAAAAHVRARTDGINRLLLLGIGGRGGALSSLRTGHRHLFALHALKPATALTAICTMPKPPAAAAALGHYLICPNPSTNWNGR